jgi:hypothetical protein
MVVPLSFFASDRALEMAWPTTLPTVLGFTMSSDRSTLVRRWPSDELLPTCAWISSWVSRWPRGWRGWECQAGVILRHWRKRTSSLWR